MRAGWLAACSAVQRIGAHRVALRCVACAQAGRVPDARGGIGLGRCESGTGSGMLEGVWCGVVGRGGMGSMQQCGHGREYGVGLRVVLMSTCWWATILYCSVRYCAVHCKTIRAVNRKTIRAVATNPSRTARRRKYDTLRRYLLAPTRLISTAAALISTHAWHCTWTLTFPGQKAPQKIKGFFSSCLSVCLTRGIIRGCCGTARVPSGDACNAVLMCVACMEPGSWGLLTVRDRRIAMGCETGQMGYRDCGER